MVFYLCKSYPIKIPLPYTAFVDCCIRVFVRVVCSIRVSDSENFIRTFASLAQVHFMVTVLVFKET